MASCEGDAGPSLFLDVLTAAPPVCSRREALALAAGSAHLSGSCSMRQETGGPAVPAPGPEWGAWRRVPSPSPPSQGGPAVPGARVGSLAACPHPLPSQDSLLRLGDHRQCFECSDVALSEAVQQMVSATEAAAKEEWVATVTQLLQGMEQALSADGSILRDLSSAGGLTRLTSNLIQVTRPPPALPARRPARPPLRPPPPTPRPARARSLASCPP